MNLTYFNTCTSRDDAKSTHRQLVKKYHPDLNKNVDITLIQDINEQWDYIIENGIDFPLTENKQRANPVDDVPKSVPHKEVINKLIQFSKIRNYKKGWLYFAFLYDMEQRQEKVTKEDLTYIAFKLGYSEYWVKYKALELNI